MGASPSNLPMQWPVWVLGFRDLGFRGLGLGV